jgi:hypothetical protein
MIYNAALRFFDEVDARNVNGRIGQSMFLSLHRIIHTAVGMYSYIIVYTYISYYLLLSIRSILRKYHFLLRYVEGLRRHTYCRSITCKVRIKTTQ